MNNAKNKSDYEKSEAARNLEEAKNRLVQAEAEKATALQELALETSEIEGLRRKQLEQIKTASEQAEEAARNLEEAQNRLEQAEAEAEEATALQELARKTTEIEGLRREQLEQIRTASEQAEKAKNRLKQADTEKATALRELTRKEGEVETLQKTIQKLSKQKDSAERQVQKLKQDLSEMSTNRGLFSGLSSVFSSPELKSVPRPLISKEARPVNIGGCRGIIEELEKLAELEKPEKCHSKFIPPEEVMNVCTEAIKVLCSEPNIVTVTGPTTVVGDLHSDYQALHHILKEVELKLIVGENIVFLGDYVDRGDYGIETTLELLKLKRGYPEQITLLRGNHEDSSTNSRYGFSKECEAKYPDKTTTDVYTLMNSVFEQLPIAAVVEVVDKKVFCVHGCIPEKDKTLDDISRLERRRPVYNPDTTDTILRDMLWSDPDSKIDVTQESERGSGWLVCKRDVEHFCEENGINTVLRAHQMVNDGVSDVFGDRRCLTVFSAPNYCWSLNLGQENKAATVHVNSDGTITEQVFSFDESRVKI